MKPHRFLAPALLGSLLASLGVAGAPLYQADTDPKADPSVPAASRAVRKLFGDVEESRSRVRLVTDNVEGWLVRWHLIEQAKESIDVTYFVYDDDIFGRSLLGLLAKKAKAGVAVRLMVDAFGARPIVGRGQGYLQALASAPGVQVRVFNPKIHWPRSLTPNVHALVSANHDKILLVDGKAAITGGRNIGWHYMASPADKAHTFQDTDVVLEGGNFAPQMKRAFDEEFERRQVREVRPRDAAEGQAFDLELSLCYQAMRRFLQGQPLEVPAGFGYATLLGKIHAELQEFPAMAGGLSGFEARLWRGEREHPTRILDKHGILGEKDEIKVALIKLLDSAEHSIYLQNAYVVLRKDIHAALARASQRGVKILLHTNGPASTNQMLTQAYFLRDWKNMMADMPTLRIFASKAGRTLHSKCFVIDDTVASVGSYNLDPLSTDLNSEIIALVDSPDFAVRLRRSLDADIAASTEYKIRRLANGTIETVVGPDAEVSGRTRMLLDLVRQIPYLRSLI